LPLAHKADAAGVALCITCKSRAHLLCHLSQLVLQLQPVLLNSSQAAITLRELAQQGCVLLPLLLKGIVGLVDLCSSSTTTNMSALATLMHSAASHTISCRSACTQTNTTS
jgi:hypothetical protein